MNFGVYFKAISCADMKKWENYQSSPIIFTCERTEAIPLARVIANKANEGIMSALCNEDEVPILGWIKKEGELENVPKDVIKDTFYNVSP